MANEGFSVVPAVITIATDTRISAEVDLGYNQDLFGILIPAAITGTVLTLHATTVEGGTAVPIVDPAGAPVEITAIAINEMVALDADTRALFSGFRRVRIRTTDAQAANRTFQLLTRPRS